MATSDKNDIEEKQSETENVEGHDPDISYQLPAAPPPYSSVVSSHDETNPTPMYMHPAPNLLVIRSRHPYPIMPLAESVLEEEIEYIDSHLVWSSISLFMGCIVLGATSLSLSLLIKRYKRERNVRRAIWLSKYVYRLNIFITLGFLLSSLFLTISFVAVAGTRDD
ncbi:unnamed protein product [Adineta ricciae]|uniref:Uncharacterized protein n=1 Tax=Adineta ricciae TaxID=249248 RepID=A0A814MXI0_ADIRI|nr:unnamed protein product [Adineta ricciae]CAF1085458.1 unnamed protein product [Adineta ricciae]